MATLTNPPSQGQKSPRMPTVFISHGGGPWPYIEEMKRQFIKTSEALQLFPASLPRKPRAVIAISGHWEESKFTIATAQNPPMEYDYSGFPAHTYKIQYPAPGSPEIAARISELLTEARIDHGKDARRGFDHGTFVPMYLMYPEADVPIVSLSIKNSYDPLEHFRLGEALKPLRNEGVLILGSGLSFHNMSKFGPPGTAISETFEAWLTQSMSLTDTAERYDRLMAWASAPAARQAHPREDHLIPLMVAAGAAGHDLGRRLFLDDVWGIKMASYEFGA
jgi:aromatic ring-opening dioxygenase catalytic subunit (LigB family)